MEVLVPKSNKQVVVLLFYFDEFYTPIKNSTWHSPLPKINFSQNSNIKI